MKKFWFLTTLLVGCLFLTGCNFHFSFNNKPEVIDDCIIPEDCINEEPIEDFVSYYDNWAIRETWTYINWMKQWTRITYDEEWNIIDIEEYQDWELINYEHISNVLALNEDEILSTDELKKLCEEKLKEVEPDNPETEWSEEKLFVSTYWFKWYTKSEWLHNDSPTYCHITLNWFVLNVWFFLDQWQTMDQLHEEIDYTPWSPYPNMEKFYWFIGNIVLGDMIQTTYITWKNTLYFDNYRWIALKLWEEFDWWLIREIDTDEWGLPHSEIIFLVKGDENEENRTWINWYREMFTIVAISKENLENFWASLDDLPFKYAPIWENNQYYFVETNIEWNYSDLQIFNVRD